MADRKFNFAWYLVLGMSPVHTIVWACFQIDLWLFLEIKSKMVSIAEASIIV